MGFLKEGGGQGLGFRVQGLGFRVVGLGTVRMGITRD